MDATEKVTQDQAAINGSTCPRAESCISSPTFEVTGYVGRT